MKKKLLALFLTVAQMAALVVTANAATAENLNWDFEDYTLNENLNYTIKKYEDDATNTLTETRVNRMLFNVLTPDGLKRLA